MVSNCIGNCFVEGAPHYLHTTSANPRVPERARRNLLYVQPHTHTISYKEFSAFCFHFSPCSVPDVQRGPKHYSTLFTRTAADSPNFREHSRRRFQRFRDEEDTRCYAICFFATRHRETHERHTTALLHSGLLLYIQETEAAVV